MYSDALVLQFQKLSCFELWLPVAHARISGSGERCLRPLSEPIAQELGAQPYCGTVPAPTPTPAVPEQSGPWLMPLYIQTKSTSCAALQRCCIHTQTR